MSDGKVIIETGLDNSGLEAGLKKLGNVTKTGLKVTTGAIAGVSTALAGTTGLAINAGIKFESAFAGVKKTVDATDQELAQFRQGIRDMAKEMPTAATEIAGVAEAAGQLGIKNDSLLSFTKTMVMLGDSTNMSADEAATSLARLANITGMPQENFDRLGSTVVALGNNLATTESEIVAMSLRIAGAGSQVGMTEAEITSFAGAMSSVGIEAEAGGTAMSTLMSKMNLAASKGGKELDQFGKVAGMSGDEFKQAFEQDAAGAILSFIQGLDKINKDGGSAIKTLDDMGLSDIRMRDALLRASGASDKFAEALGIGNDAWDKNTALTKEAEQRYQTLESKLGILKNNATDLGISLYDSLDNPLRDTVDTATDMVKSLQRAFTVDGFDGLAEQSGKVLADVATEMAEAAPAMIKAGSKTVKSFAKGIAENKDEIIDAGGELATALADGVSDLLPEDLGKALKNLTKASVTVAKPLLNVAGAMLKVAGSCSGAVPVIAGAVLAFKGYSALTQVTKALTAIRQGQAFAEESSRALTIATKLNTVATKINAATNEISKIAETGRTEAIRTQTAATLYGAGAEKSKTAATLYGTKTTVAAGVAATGTAAATTGATIATKAFSAALTLMGGPVGLAITAIGLLAGGALLFASDSDKATTAAEKQAEKVKELSDAYRDAKKSREESFASTEAESAVAGDLTDKISNLAKKTKRTADEKLRLKNYVDQLNKIMPDLNLKYDEENDKLNQNTEEIWNNVAALQTRAEAKATEALAVEAATEQKKLEKELEDAQETRDKAKVDLIATDKYAGPAGYKSLSSDWLEKNKAFEKADESLKTLKSDLNDANKEVEYWNNTTIDANKWAATIENMPGLIESLQDYIQKAKDSGIKISKSLEQGILNGKYGVLKSVKDVNNAAKFDTMVSNAKLGGTKAVKALTKKIQDGKLKPKKAVDEMQALIQFDDLYKNADKGGKKALQSLKKGIESGKTLPSKAMEQVTEAATKKSAAKGKEAKKIGEAIDSGAAGGITTKLINASAKMARESLKAAKKELGIKSPSRRFRREVGAMMVAGTVQGIKDEKKKLISSVASLMSSTVDKAKAVSGNFEAIGSSFTDSFTSKVEGRQDKQITALTNYLEKKQDAIKKSDEKEENALQKKIDKSSGSQKKAYQAELKALKKKHKEEQAAAKKAANKALSAYSSALKSQSKKLIAQAEKNIEDLSKKYQEKYDELISKRNSMQEKLMDVGDLITTTTGNVSGLNAVNGASPMAALDRNIKALEKYQKNLDAIKGKIPEDLMAEILKLGVTDANAYMGKLLKMEDDKFAEYVSKWKTEQATIKGIEDQYLNKSTLGNLNDDIDVLKEYQAGITKLKGKIPASMMEEILGMGIEEANAYMQQLFDLNGAEFDEYLKLWKEKESLANSISKGFFASDISKLQQDYSKAIDTEMGKLKTQMNRLGTNVAKAFTSGLKGQTKNMSKVVRGICNKLIKDVKKELKIKSPSRVFKDIGEMSIAGAEVGTVKRAKKLYKVTDGVAQSYAKRFAEANLDANAIYKRMQAAVTAEQCRVPAAVQTHIIKMQSQPEPEQTQRVIEIHMHTNLNDREIAHELARFNDRELAIIQERKERGL